MSNEPKPSPGIDPELLAAYVDGRLSPEQRAAIEAQLASDPESYELLVETMKAQDAIGREDDRTRVVPSPVPFPLKPVKKVRWRIVAGALAAAAVLFLFIRIQPQSDFADPQLARLVNAVGTNRHIEPRITGGFEFGPLRTPNRAGDTAADASLELLTVAAELQKEAESNPTGASLHRWGIAQLLLQRFDGAIEALRDAEVAEPRSAEIKSDLAAALMARALRSGSSADLPAGLDAAENALELSPDLTEALFNKAMALELLQLRSEAITAWEAFLSKEFDSEWESEARRRLEQLQRRQSHANPFEPPGGEDDFQRSVDRGDWSRVRFLAETQWLSKSCSDSDSRQTLNSAAARYREATGDSLLTEAVKQLPDSDMCQGLAVFAEAHRRFEQDDLPSARELFLRSRSQLKRSALVGWTDYYLGSIASLSRDFATARTTLAQTAVDASTRNHLALQAHSRWALGVTLATEGRFAEALIELQTALTVAEATHERVLIGRLRNQLADVHDYLGDGTRAWMFRQAALESAAETPNRRLRHSVYGSMVPILLRRGMVVAGQRFHSAQAAANGADTPAISQLTLCLRGAELALAREQFTEARGRLDDCASVLTRLDNDPRVESLRARLAIVQARAAAGSKNWDDSIRIATAALGSIGIGRDLQKVDLLMIRGRAQFAKGSSESGVVDLRDAVALLQKRRGSGASIFGTPELQSITDGIEQVVEAGVPASVALDLVEGLNRLTNPVAHGATHIEPDSVTLVFKVLRDSSVVWIVAGDRTEERRLPVSRADAVGLVRAVRRELFGSASEWPSTAAVDRGFDLLLDSVVQNFAHASSLRIVPDWPLDGLPFAALRNVRTGRFLIEDFDIRVSAAIRSQTRPNSGSTSIDALILADPAIAADRSRGLPRLRYAAEEGAALSKFYQRDVLLTGHEATPSALIREGAEARVVHIAAHAVVDRIDGRRSRLLLAPDRQRADLRGEDLTELPWQRVETVVLAACSTAESDGRPTSPFTLGSQVLAAGPSAVIATLTEIEDQLASRFFVELHRQLALNVDAASALRRTQLRFLSGAAGGDLTAAQRLASWTSVVLIGL